MNPLQKTPSLADRVYQQLRESIGNHLIRPGERLQEVNLAARLGVSRTPVREALARLESEGMIAFEGRGFVIPELTDVDIEEIYELRFLLEPAAVRSAVAEVDDAGDIAGMASAVEDAAAAEKAGDVAAFMDANSRFHNAWRALVPNRRLSRQLDQYVGHVRFLRVLTLSNAAARKGALSGMKKLLAAFRKGDGEAAADAMRLHLETAKEFLRLAITQMDRDKSAEAATANS